MAGLARRISNFWGGLFDALVRDNKVLPPVVALLALLLFAWVAAGAFMSGPDEERASGEAELVQSRDPSGADAPEVEDRDADSYAAYRNKDPFRQLLAPADSTPGNAPSSDDTSQDDPTGETNQGGTTTPPEDTTGGNPGGSGGTTGDDGTGGGQRSKNDSDGDGLTNRQEERLGQDPRDADTDDDGTEDGADDYDNDGVPDGQGGRAGGGGSGTGTGGGAGGSGGTGGTGGGGAGGGAGGSNGSDDELFDSGGSLRPR